MEKIKTLPKNINVDLSSQPTLKCICGSKLFNEAFIIKKIPSYLTGRSMPTIVPLKTYICASCGELPQELLPLKENKI